MEDELFTSTSWHSYPSSYALGHRAIADLLSFHVNIEEKVDGSQFSFGLLPELAKDGEPELRVRSKGAVMHPDAPMDMFKKGVAAVKDRLSLLHPGWTYRGEFLAKPKHNALAYDRTPNDNVILFDINDGHESYLSYEAKVAEAARIGFECVPLLFSGKIEGIEHFRTFLETKSILGGQTVEGVVIKPINYDYFGLDKKALMGKFVSEAFKEIHASSWKSENPTNTDVIAAIVHKYTHAARWAKAVQHLREKGELEGSPRDIGKLMVEVPIDVLKECEEEIKESLFKYAWPHIKRQLARGLPEWYKEQLLQAQFTEAPNVEK